MSKNAEVEKAWESFAASMKTLTEAGCITWVRKEGDPRADLVVELMEGENLKDDWELRVWNRDEEENEDGEVTAYVSHTKEVQELGPMLLEKVPYTDSPE